MSMASLPGGALSIEERPRPIGMGLERELEWGGFCLDYWIRWAERQARWSARFSSPAMTRPAIQNMPSYREGMS